MPLFPTLRAGLRYQLQLFFTALQLFTRLPVPSWVGFAHAWLPSAMRYFPAVGIVVALVCGAVYWAAACVFPQLLAVLLSIAAGVYLTGAFHEDGFADVCDGFGGGRQPARILEIMHDSRVGAYGVVGVVLLLTIKAASLAWLPAVQVIPALFVAHPLSRCLSGVLIWRMDYVRTEGKARFLTHRMSAVEFWIGAVTAVIPITVCLVNDLLSPRALLLAVFCGMVATFFLSRKFVRRIGGYTGDCLGAVQQLSEVAIYLGLLATTSSIAHS